jgi:RNA polymerase sigma factor (sigma-70 family)
MTSQESGKPTAQTGDVLTRLVPAACAGDVAALDQLLRGIKDRIYGLAVRMLWHPQDAEDATQEILLRIVTALRTFRGESRFSTWVLRVATNHLLNVRRSRIEREALTFSDMERDLLNGLEMAAPQSTQPDQRLLEEEVMIGCTQAMLQCLDRAHRVAYILGEVFQLTSEEAGEVLEISAAAYRQRLARARRSIRAFMTHACGLVNPDSPCRCVRRIKPAVACGRVAGDRLLFATHPRVAPETIRSAVDEMQELHATADVFRIHPEYEAPGRLIDAIRRVVHVSSQG